MAPVKTISIDPMENGWAVRGPSAAVYALTVRAAVWRYRFARREAWIIERVLGP